MKQKIFYLFLLLLPWLTTNTKAEVITELEIILDTQTDINPQTTVTTGSTPAQPAIPDYYVNINDAIQAAGVGAEIDLSDGETVNAITKVILKGDAAYTFFDLRGVRNKFPNLKIVDMTETKLAGNKIQGPYTWARDWSESAPTWKFMENGGNIQDGAFANLGTNSKITTVILPATIVGIGAKTFGNCYLLTDLALPSGLQTVGGDAFIGCTALTVAGEDLPSGMTSVGAGSFKNCSNLVLHNMPENICVVGDVAEAFSGCTKVAFSTLFTRRSGTNDGSKDYIANSAFKGTAVSFNRIPEPESWKIYQVGESAFENCPDITTMTFPKSFGEKNSRLNSMIGARAFALPAESPVERTYIFEAEIPPIGGTTASAFYKGTVLDTDAIVYVPNLAAVETFTAVTPYDQMIVRPWVLPVTVNAGTGSTVTADYNDYGELDPAGGDLNVHWGDDVTFTFTPVFGYSISKISIDDEEASDITDFGDNGAKQLTLTNVTDRHTISLEYTQDIYFVTVDPGDYGTVNTTVDPYTTNVYAVDAGGSITFTFDVDEGYIIDKVLLDGNPVTLEEGNSYTIDDIDANHTIKVQYLKNFYIITVNPGAGGEITTTYGTIIDNEIQVIKRENITFTIAPNSGYTIWRTTLNGVLVTLDAGNTYTLNNVTQDYTLSAEFVTSSPAVIYVSPDGDDSDGSSWEKAYKTFGMACSKIVASSTTILQLKEGATFSLPTTGAGSGANGRIDFKNADITIEGNHAIIKAGNTDATRIFRMGNADRILRIRNLTIQDGNGTPGAAIYFAGELLDIENCTFINNKATSGGAIASRGKNVVIRNSIFKNQPPQSSGYGGVITHTGKSGGSLIIDGCTFANNTSSGTSLYGSVICTKEGTPANNYLNEIRITNSTFYQNGSSSNSAVTGAVICLDLPNPTPPSNTKVALVNNTFYKNQTGALYMNSNYYDLTLINNVIVGSLGTTDCAVGTEKAVAGGRTPIAAKNNVIVAKTAHNANVDDSEFDSSNILTSTTASTAVNALSLASALVTPAEGIPYLPIENGDSPLIDAATVSVEGQMIPSLDALGTVRGESGIHTGFGYDIGAFEYISAAQPVWTGGGAEGDWNDPANWEDNAVPTRVDHVYIPAPTEEEVSIPVIPGGTIVKTITFEQGAQADLEGSLIVTDAVEVACEVEAERWYSMGFQFNIDEIRSEWFDSEEWGALRPYTGDLYEDTNDYGDYWIKEYDYTSPFKYHTVAGMEAGKGYIIQFPEWFEEEKDKIKFISGGQTLNNNTDIAIEENEYQFVANPKLKTIPLQSGGADNMHYYVFNKDDNKYELLEGNATAALLPFEATIAIKVPSGTSQSMLARSISIDTGVTGIVIRPDVTNDPVVATHYYTLQGVEVKRPVESGVYIVKRIFTSGEEKSEKIIHQQK
jgi:predicted outer membrane repeat protein